MPGVALNRDLQTRLDFGLGLAAGRMQAQERRITVRGHGYVDLEVPALPLRADVHALGIRQILETKTASAVKTRVVHDVTLAGRSQSDGLHGAFLPGNQPESTREAGGRL